MDDLYTKKILEFVFRIPEDDVRSTDQYKDACDSLNNCVLDLIDALTIHARLSKENKQKASRLRENAVAFIMKQLEEERKKELADKKYAALKQRKDAIMNLSPDAQRKAEQKLKKQEMKKELKKRTKRM